MRDWRAVASTHSERKSVGRMQYDHDLFTYYVAKVGFASITAFALGLIAHHDFGFSRSEIKAWSLIIATLTALPIVVDAVRTTDQKPK
jgi:hypothetical protein